MLQKTPEASEDILLKSDLLPLKATDFWAFSMKIYNNEAIKQTCLAAQETYNADINLILLCVWLDMQSLKLPKALFQELIDISHHWQTHIVGPHRELRRAATKGTSEYRHLLQEELDHERSEQKTFIDTIKAYSLLSTDKEAIILQNLDTYFAALACPKAMLDPFVMHIQHS